MATVDAGIWQRIIEHVINHGGNLIRPWFVDLSPLAMEGGLLEIQVPGPAEQKYLQDNATRLFTEAAQAATGRLVGVCFMLADDTEDDDAPQPEAEPEAGPAPAATVTTGGEVPPADETPINPDYTFENFVVGPCSRLAHAACMAVSESPGQAYNPLFIHGDVGLGKTHLLHAICHELRRKNPASRHSMLSCESFVNHFIEAVKEGQLHEFRYRYRQVDVLVIDDVQFLAGRDQTQEEFFHTFNTLHQMQKQIVLSSDRSPAEIPGLEDRLVSRFNWGLVTGVDKPSFETRVAIIRKKSQMRQIPLGDDVVCLIAGIVDSNSRELEGSISKIAMLANVYDRPIDLSLAREALGADEGENTPRTQREITIDQILDAVISRYGVRLADLQSKKRSKSIAFPRQICMHLARKLTRHSLEEIGGYFGGRDHTTVLHAYRTIQALRDSDAETNAMIETMIRELQRGA